VRWNGKHTLDHLAVDVSATRHMYDGQSLHHDYVSSGFPETVSQRHTVSLAAVNGVSSSGWCCELLNFMPSLDCWPSRIWSIAQALAEVLAEEVL
jgi:hypothetical protein